MADVETLIRSVVGRGVELVADFNRKRLPEPETPHPFLTGIHQPMTGEMTLVDLPVTGAIPPELDGRYLRIGPNPIAANPAAHHWFRQWGGRRLQLSGVGRCHGGRRSRGRGSIPPAAGGVCPRHRARSRRDEGLPGARHVRALGRSRDGHHGAHGSEPHAGCDTPRSQKRNRFAFAADHALPSRGAIDTRTAPRGDRQSLGCGRGFVGQGDRRAAMDGTS